MDNAEIKRIYELYFNTVYRISFLYMKNEHDALDVTEDTFFSMIRRLPSFENDEKAKAWLIVTASNKCRTLLKKWWNKRNDYTEAMKDVATEDNEDSVLSEVLNLSDKYRIPTYLYYYEGYKTSEIGEMLGEKPSTIQTRLAKARKLLKLELEEK